MKEGDGFGSFFAVFERRSFFAVFEKRSFFAVVVVGHFKDSSFFASFFFAVGFSAFFKESSFFASFFFAVQVIAEFEKSSFVAVVGVAVAEGNQEGNTRQSDSQDGTEHRSGRVSLCL